MEVFKGIVLLVLVRALCTLEMLCDTPAVPSRTMFPTPALSPASNRCCSLQYDPGHADKLVFAASAADFDQDGQEDLFLGCERDAISSSCVRSLASLTQKKRCQQTGTAAVLTWCCVTKAGC